MTGGSVFAFDRAAGIALLLVAAFCYTCHMTGIRLWQMNWRDVVVVVPTVNVILLPHCGTVCRPEWPRLPTTIWRFRPFIKA